MDSSPIICNAGPLIALTLAGQLQVLPALYKHILVPEAVWHEIVDSGFGRAGAAELKASLWIEVVPPIAVDSFLEAELGRGESQVIALGRAREAALVLMDELLARRVAGQTYGPRVKGSAGIHQVFHYLSRLPVPAASIFL